MEAVLRNLLLHLRQSNAVTIVAVTIVSLSLTLSMCSETGEVVSCSLHDRTSTVSYGWPFTCVHRIIRACDNGEHGGGAGPTFIRACDEWCCFGVICSFSVVVGLIASTSCVLRRFERRVKDHNVWRYNSCDLMEFILFVAVLMCVIRSQKCCLQWFAGHSNDPRLLIYGIFGGMSLIERISIGMSLLCFLAIVVRLGKTSLLVTFKVVSVRPYATLFFPRESSS
jgi:hypothetical protein